MQIYSLSLPDLGEHSSSKNAGRIEKKIFYSFKYWKIFKNHDTDPKTTIKFVKHWLSGPYLKLVPSWSSWEQHSCMVPLARTQLPAPASPRHSYIYTALPTANSSGPFSISPPSVGV